VQAQRKPTRGPKIRIITIGLLRDLSEIKLKRTDTTLDLSQKAKRAEEEKRKRRSFASRPAGEEFYTRSQGGESGRLIWWGQKILVGGGCTAGRQVPLPLQFGHLHLLQGRLIGHRKSV
jgi:hypothetical protein